MAKKKVGRPSTGKPKIDSRGAINPRFMFTLTDEMKGRLRTVAEKNGRTMSQEVAFAVRQHIARELGEPLEGAGS